jgi:4-hydroxy-tetrahydrodipicolinate synthase
LADTETLTRHARDLGAHGCLMLPPFYFKGIGDAGVLASFRQVIERVWGSGQGNPAAGGLRLYPYNIPQLSGAPLSHVVIRTLLQDHPQVIAGIKDSQCDRALLAVAGRGLHAAAADLCRQRAGPEGARPPRQPGRHQRPGQLHAARGAPAGARSGRHRHRRGRGPGGGTLLQRVGGYALLPALKGLMAAASGDAAWLRVRAPLIPLDAAQAESMAELARELHLDLTAD